MNVQAQLKAVPAAADDSAKRRQIVEGAREIFLAKGFDAASMSDIARTAGVSKGTLYVYFENKEQLFEAIVHAECLVHAEGAFALDHGNHDIEAVLIKKLPVLVLVQTGVVERIAPIISDCFARRWAARKHEGGARSGMLTEDRKDAVLVVRAQVPKAVPSDNAVEDTAERQRPHVPYMPILVGKMGRAHVDHLGR